MTAYTVYPFSFLHENHSTGLMVKKSQFSLIIIIIVHVHVVSLSLATALITAL